MRLRNAALAPLLLLLAVACNPAADAAPGTPPAEVGEAAAPAPVAPSGPRPGRWAGVVTEGYKGDSIRFTVSPAGEVSDVVLSGHWRCGPTPSSRTIKRMDVGHVPGAFAVAGDGSFGGERKEPYLLWTVAGRFAGPAAASGTIRVEYDTECDTHRLNWTAAPVAE